MSIWVTIWMLGCIIGLNKHKYIFEKMTRLVDFCISTPRNRTQSSNECGVVINNTVRNHVLGDRSPAEYPSVPPVPVPVPVVARDVSPELPPDTTLFDELNTLRLEHGVYKEIAMTLSRILKSTNAKLLVNLIDQSGKIIVDRVSLVTIIAKHLNVPVDAVHIEYTESTGGCFAKVCKVYDIQDIRIYHIDFRLGYNEKYNVLKDEFAISLTKVML
jgi:hypothetical protein